MEFEQRLRPGDLIKTSKGLFWHFSIVSNRRCAHGKLMLISSRKETGTMHEEPCDGVVGGRMTAHARHQSALPPHKILNAKAVREKLARGGSLSTFTRVINAWRAEMAENEEVEAPASEIVEDRASVLDDGTSAVADTESTIGVKMS